MPIFLSGKVMMEDGTPPPEQVAIERVCNMRRVIEGYTDRKGRFSFQVGGSQNQYMDASTDMASASGGLGLGGGRSGGVGPNRGISERELQGCEIQAVLPGYRTAVVQLAGRRRMENPDLGTLLLRRIGKAEGMTISMTSALAPKDAKKAYEKGIELARKGKVTEAEASLQKAVDEYPKYAVAWLNLGQTQEQQGNAEAAMKSYQQAAQADSKYVLPYVRMAGLSAKTQKWPETIEASEKALKLDPFGFPQAYFLHAVATMNTGRRDDAEKSVREGLKIDAEHQFPQMEHLLGVILIDKQEYKEAADHLQAYLKLSPSAANSEKAKQQLEQVRALLAQK